MPEYDRIPAYPCHEIYSPQDPRCRATACACAKLRSPVGMEGRQPYVAGSVRRRSCILAELGPHRCAGIQLHVAKVLYPPGILQEDVNNPSQQLTAKCSPLEHQCLEDEISFFGANGLFLETKSCLFQREFVILLLQGLVIDVISFSCSDLPPVWGGIHRHIAPSKPIGSMCV